MDARLGRVAAVLPGSWTPASSLSFPPTFPSLLGISLPPLPLCTAPRPLPLPSYEVGFTPQYDFSALELHATDLPSVAELETPASFQSPWVLAQPSCSPCPGAGRGEVGGGVDFSGKAIDVSEVELST